MIYTVTVNPALDYVMQLKRLMLVALIVQMIVNF